MNKDVDELHAENGESIYHEDMITDMEKIRYDKTYGTIKSKITFILNDVRAHWPTQVEWYSCRRLHQH